MVKKILVSVATISVLFSSSVMACPSGNGIKACSPSSFKHARKSKHCIVTQVTKAISKTGLNASQTKKVAQGIKEYRATTAKIKEMKIFPIDSFINDEFDENLFIKEMSEKYKASIVAKATLFKYIFSILDIEQRKIFKREYAAPLIEQIIRNY